MCDFYECNGVIFDKFSEATRYANFLFNATGIVHAITIKERI